jgi:hypothetical protein
VIVTSANAVLDAEIARATAVTAILRGREIFMDFLSRLIQRGL